MGVAVGLDKKSGKTEKRRGIGAALARWRNYFDGALSRKKQDVGVVSAKRVFSVSRSPLAGLSVANLIFDRTEGRPSQSVNLSGQLAADPALEITQQTLDLIRRAGAGLAVDDGDAIAASET